MRYTVPPVEQRANDAEIMAHALENFRSLGRGDDATQNYWRGKARASALRHVSPITPEEVNRGGSWNHPIAAAVLLGLMENQHWDTVRQYCKFQLDGTHKGLWGAESLSHIYPHPVPYLAMAFEAKPDPEIRAVLRAHAYFLTLLTLPRGYRREAGEGSGSEGAYSNGALPFHVCCGGMRSQWPFRGNVFLTYALAAQLRSQAPALPTWRQTHRRIQGWPCRVMKHTPHAYLSNEDRQLLKAHIANPNPEPIIAELSTLGVRSRSRLEIARYANGDGYSFFSKNTHASTPPLMGQSLVGGKYRTLALHPAHLRGTPNGNAVGRVSASRVGDRIQAEAESVRAGGSQGDWPPIDRRGAASGEGHFTVNASIPIPSGEPLYRIIVDQAGIRLEGSTPGPTPGPTPSPTPGPTPGANARITEALVLLDQAIPGIELESQARIAAEVLRRTLRGDRAGALSGAGVLVRRLRR
ncbi:MAG: hypothetical protein AAF560_10345 [Acidobacteriota bacterium]